MMPSGQVGSIGVFALHADMSGMLEQAGIKVTLVKAGKYKAEGLPYFPLGDEATAHMQAQAEGYLADFVADVALGRHVSPRPSSRGRGVRGG